MIPKKGWTKRSVPFLSFSTPFGRAICGKVFYEPPAALRRVRNTVET